MNRFVLIDGNAILHRAYHALPPFTTSKGEPVGAVFGFVSMFLKVISDLKPTHIAVCFDMEKPTFRQELYVGYQAQRPKMESELSSQVEGVHRVLEAMDIAIFEVEGYEADDIIGTLAKQALARGPVALLPRPTSSVGKLPAGARRGSPALATPHSEIEIIIVTGDRDMLQLVNSHVKVYAPIRGLSETKLYDRAAVLEKYGIEPSQIVDMKALTGDPSDNYPGVAGVGPKTASTLIQKYGTLENIYKNLSRLSENQAKALAEGAESAGLAKKLAAIVTDVPLQFNLEHCRFHIQDKEKAVEVLRSFEFKTLTNRFIELVDGKQREAKSTPKVPPKSNDNSSDQLRLV